MRATLVVTICAVALVIAGLVSFNYVNQKYAKPVRDLSKMMAVRNIIAPALEKYYEQNGRYPASLNDLPLHELRWGDEGSSPRDVENWRYSSDDRAFTMMWEHQSRMRLFMGGRHGHLYCTE